MENVKIKENEKELIKEEIKEEPKKERMIEQDIAKGIAIILVIALHTLTLKSSIYNILGGIFGFIMPFYFFMAGYNHRPYRYTYKEILKRRFKQIIIPFFTYSISILIIAAIYYMACEGYTIKMVLMTYLNLLLSTSFCKQVGIEIISGGLYNTIMVFWFIQMLFAASLIFYLVVDYALEKASRLISIIIGLLFITMLFGHFNFHLPFYLAEAPAIAAIMLLGAFFGQKELLSNKTKLSFIIMNSIISYALFIILAMLFKGSGFIAGGNLWDKRIYEWAVLLSFVFAIVGTYPFVHVCRLLRNVKFVSKGLAWCGNNSMPLLFIHGVVQLYICVILKIQPFRMSFSSNENDFRTFYVLALEILFSVLIIILISFIKKKIKNIKNKKEELNN